jgi:hypothetical protein
MQWQSIIGIATVVATFSFSAEASQRYCPFSYQRTVQEIVLPELKRKLGDRSTLFSTDDVLLAIRKGEIEITISQLNAVDSDNFVIMFEPCSQTISKSYLQSTIPR